MGKSRFAKLPNEQRCKFLIGPASSWFLPCTSDIWTQPKGDDSMDCDQSASLSYFMYGSLGCFCYGEIHHHKEYDNNNQSPRMSAIVNRIIYTKDDNSRVCCVKFLKTSLFPKAMVLTENGSLTIHDCLTSENLVHFKKSELVAKFLSINHREEHSGEHCNKRAKFNAQEFAKSCIWANAKNAFLGVSLYKEEANLLCWMKMRDLNGVSKTDIIESHETISLPNSDQGIYFMEHAMLNDQICLVAVAMQAGPVYIVVVNFERDQAHKIIRLNHQLRVRSMSFHVSCTQTFSLGLLATVTEIGKVQVWDIEEKYCFADYYRHTKVTGKKIDWFSLSFIELKEAKQNISLVVSQPDGSLNILHLPKNIKPGMNRFIEQVKRNDQKQTISHKALLFNVRFDPITETIMTSSYDGSHILWTCQKRSKLSANKNDPMEIDIMPQYLYPSMPHDSRTHMLRHRPINPKEDIFAMALGKAGIRFCKFASNSKNSKFDMTPSYVDKHIRKHLSPSSVAWHPIDNNPKHEYLLALGSLEGKVVQIDLKPNRSSIINCVHRPVLKSRIEIEKSDNREKENDIFDVEYQLLERPSSENNYTENNEPTRSNQSNSLEQDGIYSLCWGPNPTCPNDMTRFAIYAVGSISNRLFIYCNRHEDDQKLTNYLDDYLDQSLPEAIGESSEVAWKSNMDLMALGTTNGKVIIVSYVTDSKNCDEVVGREKGKDINLFHKLAVIRGPLGAAPIQCLAWHPTLKSEDSNYYFIAVSTKNDPTAYIFNIGENVLVADVKSRLQIQAKDVERDQSSIISNYVYKLEAHKGAISDIAWNPHAKSDHQLATSSFDRFCYVWSISGEKFDSKSGVGQEENINAQILSKFSACDRLFTLEWSLVDKDLIFTSGRDSTIWAWRPSENLYSHSVV